MKKLSIIIPVYNEENTLERIISKIEAVDLPVEKELIFVDDLSSDRSREILYRYQGKYKVVFLNKNSGKGFAVRRGFKEISGDVAIIQDADLEYDPKDYLALISPILAGRVDVVYGSRFLGQKKDAGIVYRRGYFFSRFLNRLSNFLSGVYLSDMYTCYKVFSKEAINKIYPHLLSKRFGIDPELTAWVAKLKLGIMELPISYKGRTYEEGKKINWKDGIAAIWHIIRFNIFA